MLVCFFFFFYNEFYIVLGMSQTFILTDKYKTKYKQSEHTLKSSLLEEKNH